MKRKKQPASQLASNLSYNNNNELIRALEQKQTTLNHMLLFIFVYRITTTVIERERERESRRLIKQENSSRGEIHPKTQRATRFSYLAYLLKLTHSLYLLIAVAVFSVNDLVSPRCRSPSRRLSSVFVQTKQNITCQRLHNYYVR